MENCTDKKYIRDWHAPVNPSSEPSNDSLTSMYDLTPVNSLVLDVGCSIGQLGKELVNQKECVVFGIEYNEEAAQEASKYLKEVKVADIERVELGTLWPELRFDRIIFADVLEHIRNPLEVLLQAKGMLAPSGSILISLPNISHASVRLGLLQGRFEYRREGLLDATHLHFYTRHELDQLLSKAGLRAIKSGRTILGALATEIPVYEDATVSLELVSTVEQLPDATTYQFIVEAVAAEPHEPTGLIEDQGFSKATEKLSEPSPPLTHHYLHEIKAEIVALRRQILAFEDKFLAIDSKFKGLDLTDNRIDQSLFQTQRDFIDSVTQLNTVQKGFKEQLGNLELSVSRMADNLNSSLLEKLKGFVFTKQARK